LIYGGAAGGGKSWYLRYEALRGIHHKEHNAIIFRRKRVDVVGSGGAGSMWGEASSLYRSLGAKSNDTKLTCRFPSGATIQFSHLQHEKDCENHQGQEYTYVGFDEGTHFTEYQFWSLYGRLRTTSNDIKPYIRLSCNPDPDSFVCDLVLPWLDEHGDPIPELDGEVKYIFRDNGETIWVDDEGQPLTADSRDAFGKPPISIAFIAARLEDNKYIDDDYEQKLNALTKVERARKKDGNWFTRERDGLFKEHQITAMVPSALPSNVRWVRYWDLAHTDPSSSNPNPDATAGALIGLWRDEAGKHHVCIADMARRQVAGSKKEKWIKSIAVRDDAWLKSSRFKGTRCQIVVEQEPASGKELIAIYQTGFLSGHLVEGDLPRGDKEARARLWLPHAQTGYVHLLTDEHGHIPPWHREFIGELESFPNKKKDQVDAVSGGFAYLTKAKPKFNPKVLGTF
jgi:phage terminase large subunit-like protein